MGISDLAFDFNNGAVILRVICGLFFLPHIYSKIVGDPPPVLGFFEAVGFKPAGFWVKVAAVVELAAAAALLFDVYTQWAALVAATVLLIAAITLCILNRGVKWLWNTTGIEYPVFWALCCLIVALQHWGQS